jgi:TPR repeat protein
MKRGLSEAAMSALALVIVLLTPASVWARSGSAATKRAAEFAAAVASYNRADYASALRLLHHLADQGYAPAQNNLGMMFATGQGALQDYAAAAALLRSAAVQGYALGEYDLGALYGYGLGMPQDYVQAYKWFALAVTAATDTGARDVATKGRDGVAAAMTPAQITQAQKLADDCLGSHFLRCD